MNFTFDLITVLLIVLLIIVFFYLFFHYRVFKRFILDVRERERLFTDEQMKNYINKLDTDKELLKYYVEEFASGKNVEDIEQETKESFEENMSDDDDDF